MKCELGEGCEKGAFYISYKAVWGDLRETCRKRGNRNELSCSIRQFINIFRISCIHFRRSIIVIMNLLQGLIHWHFHDMSNFVFNLELYYTVSERSVRKEISLQLFKIFHKPLNLTPYMTTFLTVSQNDIFLVQMLRDLGY